MMTIDDHAMKKSTICAHALEPGDLIMERVATWCLLEVKTKNDRMFIKAIMFAGHAQTVAWATHPNVTYSVMRPCR